jgi:hypothetical protein
MGSRDAFGVAKSSKGMTGPADPRPRGPITFCSDHILLNINMSGLPAWHPV